MDPLHVRVCVSSRTAFSGGKDKPHIILGQDSRPRAVRGSTAVFRQFAGGDNATFGTLMEWQEITGSEFNSCKCIQAKTII